MVFCSSMEPRGSSLKTSDSIHSSRKQFLLPLQLIMRLRRTNPNLNRFFPEKFSMRYLWTLFLICFLITITAMAGSLNPGSMGVATVSTTPRPVITMVPQTIVTAPVTATITVPVSVPLSIRSDPSGATISVNGLASDFKTPATIHLSTGPHTIGLSLKGYMTSTTTVTLMAGTGGIINARLEQLTVDRQNVTPLNTTESPHISPGMLVPATLQGTGYLDSCTSDQKCLTLAEAESAYAPGFWYLEAICGYATTGNPPAPKYCTGGSPKATLQPGHVMPPVTVPAGARVHVANISPVPVFTGESPLPSQPPRVLGGMKPVGVVDSFFGLFIGLFAKPVSCPEGTTACSGRCTFLTNDSANCGACDYTCFEPAVCQSGQCKEEPKLLIR